MAVNDEPAVIAAMRQERLSDPQQIVRLLRLERACRIDAGMNKKTSPVVMGEAQAPQPIDVFGAANRGHP